MFPLLRDKIPSGLHFPSALGELGVAWLGLEPVQAHGAKPQSSMCVHHSPSLVPGAGRGSAQERGFEG